MRHVVATLLALTALSAGCKPATPKVFNPEGLAGPQILPPPQNRTSS